MDDKRHLLNLIQEGEHQQQDFKYRVADASKLAKSVSAFANTYGGRLLIGVRDDGHLSGVRSEEEIFMMHQAAYKYCKPEASIKFDTYHAEGRTIVVATVPPSVKRPVRGLACAFGPLARDSEAQGIRHGLRRHRPPVARCDAGSSDAEPDCPTLKTATPKGHHPPGPSYPLRHSSMGIY